MNKQTILEVKVSMRVSEVTGSYNIAKVTETEQTLRIRPNEFRTLVGRLQYKQMDEADDRLRSLMDLEDTTDEKAQPATTEMIPLVSGANQKCRFCD